MSLSDYAAIAEYLTPYVIQAESGGNPNAVSSKGARGLGQVMPKTATAPGYGVKPMRGEGDNTRFTKDYLAAMLNEYGGHVPTALAAYNAGPGTVNKGGRMPKETQDYVNRVTGALPKAEQAAPQNSLADEYAQYLEENPLPNTSGQTQAQAEQPDTSMSLADEYEQWLKENEGAPNNPASPTQPAAEAPPNPEDESAYNKFGMGAGIAGLRALSGLKGLVTGQTPQDKAELEAGKQYIERAGLPAKAGNLAGETAIFLPVGAIPGAGLAGMAARVAGSGVLAAATAPEDRLKAGVAGAAGAGVGEGLSKGVGLLARGLSERAAPGVEEAVNAGIKPTLAQAMGREKTGGIKSFEETLKSSPFIGREVARAHSRATESVNTASLRDVVTDLERDVKTGKLPEAGDMQQIPVASSNEKYDLSGIVAGHEGIKEVHRIVNDQYRQISEKTSGSLDSEMMSGLEKIALTASKGMRPESKTQIDSIINDFITSRFKEGQRLPGEQIREIDSELGKFARDHIHSSVGEEHRIGTAALEAQSQLRQMMERQNPNYKEALSGINRAFQKMMVIDKAATASAIKEGMFTPGGLLNASLGLDKSVRKGHWAEGGGISSDWGENLQRIVGNTYPDSGTAGRASTGIELATTVGAPQVAIPAFGLSKMLYSPAVQDYLVQKTLQPMSPVQRGLSSIAAKLAKPAGIVGAGATSNRSR
jgi:hypothetical protein